MAEQPAQRVADTAQPFSAASLDAVLAAAVASFVGFPIYVMRGDCGFFMGGIGIDTSDAATQEKVVAIVQSETNVELMQLPDCVARYAREADGFTYFQLNGELWAAHTLRIGDCDIDSAGPVSEWDSNHLGAFDYAEIQRRLDEAAAIARHHQMTPGEFAASCHDTETALADNALRFVHDSLAGAIRKPTVIRAFMEGGLLQAVTGLPAGFVLRKIDLDVEGSDDDETVVLKGDDIPPYVTAQHQAREFRGFVGEFNSDGSNTAVDAPEPGFVPQPPPFREADCGGVLGADGNVYSDADPGL